jgi:hypothetical protein
VVWASDLAERVMALAGSAETGIRHVTATRPLSRVELADHLLKHFGIDAAYERESRHDRAVPHLGRVELATRYRGALFEPLPSVLDRADIRDYRSGDEHLPPLPFDFPLSPSECGNPENVAVARTPC